MVIPRPTPSIRSYGGSIATIVVEGVDGTGKTTLARAFERRGFTYVHHGPPPPDTNMFDYYLKQLLDARGKNVVFDRLHLGEWCYGPVMRNGSKITTQDVRLLNRVLHASPGVVILCSISDEEAVKAWERRRENEYVDTPEKLRHIACNFRQLWREEYFEQRLEYDFLRFKNWQDEFVSSVIRNFKTYPALKTCIDSWTISGVSGTLTPRFMFVGERPGGNVDLGFCTMKGSSGYLNGCLWRAGYRESEVLFVNAYDHWDVARSISSLHSFLYRPTVVTLGQVAKYVCQRQKVRHIPLEHPSYRKRFHLKQTDEYVRQLKRIREGVLGESA